MIYLNGHDYIYPFEHEEDLIDPSDYADNPETDPYYGVRWKVMKNHPMYEISDDGTIRSWKGNIARVIKTWPNQYGHRNTRLDGEHISIHREVAEAFIPNPNNYPVVRHLDDDPTNNYYKNLAWGTQADNIHDCIAHGRNFVKAVYCYENRKTYASCAEAADDLGVTRGAITLCCQGKTHECKGYHLCYLDDKDDKMSKQDEWLKYSPYKALKATNIETGEELYFQSRKEASKALRIPDCGISSNITGRISHSHGWKFEDRS